MIYETNAEIPNKIVLPVFALVMDILCVFEGWWVNGVDG